MKPLVYETNTLKLYELFNTRTRHQFYYETRNEGLILSHESLVESRFTFILKYLLFNAAINGIHWLQEIPYNFPQTA